MTDHELELRLRSWYRADGEADRAPAALRASVAAIPVQGRRVVRLPWAGSTSRLSFRLAAAAVIAVLAVGGAFYALTPRQPAVGGPSPTPGMSSNPTSSSPSPVATPGPAAVIAYINYVYRTGSPMVPTGRVWIVNADGTGAHELFPGGTGNQSGVAWSPDGTHLVYRELPGPGELPGGPSVPGLLPDLYLTDARGSQPQLVDAGCACSDYDAAFSPDGTQLVVVRGTASSQVIATMNLASGRVVELSSTAAVPALERPRWSPDGTKIVFSRGDKFGNKFGNGAAVFIVDADGTNLHQLSTAALPARLPDWSPDGSRIVFTSFVVSWPGGVMKRSLDVYTVRPDWTDLRRLTSDGNAIEATWTPDGRILFVTGGSNESGLWVMNADGSNARLLVPRGDLFPNGGNAAAWQPTP
jgi:Tol biopolymer transport system component